MSGIEALVQLPLEQRRRDRAAGLRTAGLISGYRGSPLGAYDQALWRAQKRLAEHDVVFQPGLNEDLAATALWGAQMHAAFGPTRTDGVFGLWYGKGPGVDRSGDVFRNANVHGTSRLGGVLAVAGDDHAAQSSMFPHQTDGVFQSVMMPVLQPASVGDVLSLGLAGFALSRFAGVWVGLKVIAEVVETAATFDWTPAEHQFRPPADHALPAHGLNWDPALPWPAQRAELERRLVEERLPAVAAFARTNRLDRVVVDGPKRRLGVVTVGKAHGDVLQAMSWLGLSPARLRDLGISIYKVAMSWPLETEGVRAFAEGLEEILVVEEKAPAVEDQIKAALFHLPRDRRPRVVGKQDEQGRPLLSRTLELDPVQIAEVLARRAGGLPAEALGRLAALRPPAPSEPPVPARRPFFCAGCPHNRSTRTPDGSISGGGIGCHVMALSQPDLKTTTFSQMGGEGVQWVGAAPFVETPHIFQNLGDGTYQHSGVLAVRAAVAARTNITFKILYNDAVAMTGGQPAEGAADPPTLARQLLAEGVGAVALVAEDPGIWRGADLPEGVALHPRGELDAVQRRLRETPGVTAIIYEQTCASEKRRRRKRGTFPDPPRRLFINSLVCEGCGDCHVQSNCIAVEPLDTPYGRKRAINQSACNKDRSCLDGFCPSFVELDDARLARPDPARLEAEEGRLLAQLPPPGTPAPPASGTCNIYVAGVGGSGVLTLGALLGRAAHLQGLASSVLDFTGLAQKNGAVVSQVRLARSPDQLNAPRLGPGEADTLIAADLVVGCAPDALARLGRGRTTAVVNLREIPTADFVLERDARTPVAPLRRILERRLGPDRVHGLEATGLAEGLFGDAVLANVLLLGHAVQKGLIPLAPDAVEAAIREAGLAVDANLRAFRWGRVSAAAPEAAASAAGLTAPPAEADADALCAELARYQDAAYAARFRALVDAATDRDAELGRVVARNAFRVMAYKDEYEVARLYSDGRFRAELKAAFGGWSKISLWLAPPLLARRDPASGRPRKIRFGPWVLPLLGTLARLRRLRGTPLDVFGWTAERRMERALVEEYFAAMETAIPRLAPDTRSLVFDLAVLPSQVRGFGPVKAAAAAAARRRRAELLAALMAAGAAAGAAPAAAPAVVAARELA